MWLLSFAAFFFSAKREYWRTFWNTETAAQYTKRVRWDSNADVKHRAMLLVSLHPSLLRLVADDAERWLLANWDSWTDAGKEELALDWFTDEWKRSLPDSVIPQQMLQALGGKSRRRSTLAERRQLNHDAFVDVASSGAKATPLPH